MGAHMSPEDHDKIWELVDAGESYASIGTVIGRRLTTVRDYVNKHHGRRPLPPKPRSERRLSVAEREEISRGLALDESFRTIAARIGRSPSTVSREVSVNGGRDAYRAVAAEANVAVRARRPKTSKLAGNGRLRAVVDEKLAEFWSPEQIAGWLRVEHPDDATMWVSHEAIYFAVYAGWFETRPKRCLRTRRTMRRRRHRRKNQGQGMIRNPTMIADRPAHVDDRVEGGHWEGDLIIGNRSTALATLVERVSRYTLLVPLPGLRTMDALNQAVTAAFEPLPASLRRSLTWDQGKEIHGHAELAEATGMTVYVCNPHSPWQRGTNENTNGLLRQWFPRSTNFYDLDPEHIAAVQRSLNSRPRRTLGFRTPTVVFAGLTA
jgi:IS30 family transposase